MIKILYFLINIYFLENLKRILFDGKSHKINKKYQIIINEK